VTGTSRGASLDLQGLVKRYGNTAAVDNVSLKVPAGEFVTLLGPSGSGKTTTLNIIAGFTAPDEGHVMMDDKPIEGVPPYRRNIGMVFQNYALFPHMTVESNVAFPLKRRRAPKAEIKRKVADILALVGLHELGGRYPRELSGGQQQRVALARALVFEPHVLLMDEPLGALDKRLREGLQLEFRRIHRELGITFIYVTHDQHEALVMSDRIAVFNHGRIEQVGASEELYERPGSLFVAGFLGDSNVLRGIVNRSNGVPRLVSDGTQLILPPRGSVADGAEAAIVIRPEKIAMSSAGGSHPEGSNVLSGRVVEVIYMGALRRIEVAVENAIRVRVQEQTAATASIEPGDAVVVSWRPEDAVLLSDAEPSGAASAEDGDREAADAVA
jgi:putative spermidine/putrescine transport system ATP-binding protein